MSRRREVPKRYIIPDPIYKEQIVTKFMNCLMLHGKKAAAEMIVYRAIETMNEKDGTGVAMFKKAIENVKPRLEVKSRRIGGSNFQVPIEVRPERRTSLAIRWLIGHARKRSGRNMEEKIAAEMMDAAENRGGAVKKREDVHKMAEANRAFAHFRW